MGRPQGRRCGRRTRAAEPDRARDRGYNVERGGVQLSRCGNLTQRKLDRASSRPGPLDGARVNRRNGFSNIRHGTGAGRKLKMDGDQAIKAKDVAFDTDMLARIPGALQGVVDAGDLSGFVTLI